MTDALTISVITEDVHGRNPWRKRDVRFAIHSSPSARNIVVNLVFDPSEWKGLNSVVRAPTSV
jgi:hypothetical protein